MFKGSFYSNWYPENDQLWIIWSYLENTKHKIYTFPGTFDFNSVIL